MAKDVERHVDDVVPELDPWPEPGLDLGPERLLVQPVHRLPHPDVNQDSRSACSISASDLPLIQG